MTADRARRPRLVDLAARTPPERDRYADFLRAFSIGIVVLGHWLMAHVEWRDGEITGDNALSLIPGLWLLTWVLQVMPVFFFIGGFSNLVSIDAVRRRGGGYPEFLAGRAERLLRPTAVFLTMWMSLVTLLDIAGVGGERLALAGRLVARPLWFLGIYLVLILLAPAMLSLHRRAGLAVPVGLAGGAAAVDVLRFGFDVPHIAFLNSALVWLLAHQLGFFYADGSLVRAGHRLHTALAAGGLLGLVVLTSTPLYPGSMVGLPADRISNMDPPTVCIVALIALQTGLTMRLREPAGRWLARTRPWAAVIGVNTMIMTAFLWHLSALLIAVLALFPLGWPQPDAGTATWWLLRPVWILILGGVLAGLVGLFGRAERPRSAAAAAVRSGA